MSDTCTVCARPDRAEVDAALDAGEPIAGTARRFGISRRTLQRHAKHRDAKPANVQAGLVEGDQVHPAASAPLPEAPPVDHPAVSDSGDLAAREPPPSITPLPEAPPVEASTAPQVTGVSGRNPCEKPQDGASTSPPPSPPPEPASHPEVDLLAVFEQVQEDRRAAPERSRGGRPCACCTSGRRQEIDAAIGSGMSYRGIERRYGVSDNSARHHATGCVPEALARAADARAAAEAQTVDTVLEEVTRLSRA